MAHHIEVRDPAQTVTVTDTSHAFTITLNGQHSAVVSDTLQTVVLQDPDHTLTLA